MAGQEDVFILLSFRKVSSRDLNTVNGGYTCAVCTVVVGLVEQTAQVHSKNISDVVSDICNYFPTEIKTFCKIVIDLFGPIVIKKLERKETPDVICYSLGLCYKENEYCHLFPLPQEEMHLAVEKSRKISRVLLHGVPWFESEKFGNSICNHTILGFLCKMVKRFIYQEKPGYDLDGDSYSDIQDFRGSSWRGKDCNDFSKDIHPGRRPAYDDKYIDSNCNGIWGTNDITGEPYEKELCEGTNPQGLVYIGDSVGAHFHFPSQWVTAAELLKKFFKHFIYILGNELDWPETSFATGYKNLTWPTITGYTDSIYLRLRQHNLCIHRDYQNLAVNGADSSSTLQYIKALARNKTLSLPVIAIYAMMGNDICSSYMKSLNDLIKPATFKENVLKTLNYLDDVLPLKSQVVLIGLVNGSFIYPAMAKHLHPIGQLNKDVTYADVYEWFNCMKIGPCYEWMNKNETIRTGSTKHAIQLSNILKQLATEYKFKSFTLHYFDNPLHKVMQAWKNAGNEIWQMLEPADGFHPTQKLQPFITKQIWKDLVENNIIGKANPNNEQIYKLFGDQGGH